jgi:hypothetical protein
VENWQAKRDEWVAAVEQIAADAEAWAQEQQWLVHRGRKTLTEDKFGTYEIPMLTMHTPEGPLILDPIGLDIVGASGRVDLCAFPSYENVMIVRTDASWHFVISPPTVGRPWSKEAFLEIAPDLARKR